MLVQRSQALIDYHTMFFAPHFIHQTKHARERKTQRDRETERETKAEIGRDRKRVDIIMKAFFHERKTKYL